MDKFATKKRIAPAALARVATGSTTEPPAPAHDAPALAPSPSAPLALRVNDFCARMGVSPSTFWKFVQLGKIRVVRCGGRTLVPAEEAARILREGVK